jgi:prolyl 4-hydroxylase
MKGKSKRSKANLGLPIVILLCLLFLLAGFFGSMLLSQDVPRVRPRLRTLELLEEEEDGSGSMPHGQTGEAFIEPIPFQVYTRVFHFSMDCSISFLFIYRYF